MDGTGTEAINYVEPYITAGDKRYQVFPTLEKAWVRVQLHAIGNVTVPMTSMGNDNLDLHMNTIATDSRLSD